MDSFELLYHKLNANILCIAYRGYSESEGSPSEQGLQKDANAMIEYLKSRSDIN
jgi:alpha/beta superfamily hydrolase